MDIHCSATVESELTSDSLHPFKRTDDLIDNTRYFARFFNFQIDLAQHVKLTVTSNSFTPFLSFYRDVDNIVRSASGVIDKDVGWDTTGPWTLEVSSVDPYDTGDFSVQVECVPAPVCTAPGCLKADDDFIAAFNSYSGGSWDGRFTSSGSYQFTVGGIQVALVCVSIGPWEVTVLNGAFVHYRAPGPANSISPYGVYTANLNDIGFPVSLIIGKC
jgi:hypothetical protein